MNKSKLISQIKSLSHQEKLELLLFLASELAQKEGVIDSSETYLHEIRNSFEVANQLKKLLQFLTPSCISRPNYYDNN